MGSLVTTLVELPHRGRFHREQAVPMAKDGPPVGMIRAGVVQELLQHLLIRLIGVLGDLLQHHLPLRGEGFPFQGRAEHQVQQELERPLGRVWGDQHMKVHVIKAGCGIAAATQGLNGTIKGAGLEPFASLEHHVLEEVSHAFLASRFSETPGSAPQVQAGQRCLRHLRRHAAHPIGKAPVV